MRREQAALEATPHPPDEGLPRMSDFSILEDNTPAEVTQPLVAARFALLGSPSPTARGPSARAPTSPPPAFSGLVSDLLPAPARGLPPHGGWSDQVADVLEGSSPPMAPDVADVIEKGDRRPRTASGIFIAREHITARVAAPPARRRGPCAEMCAWGPTARTTSRQGAAARHLPLSTDHAHRMIRPSVTKFLYRGL